MATRQVCIDMLCALSVATVKTRPIRPYIIAISLGYIANMKLDIISFYYFPRGNQRRVH